MYSHRASLTITINKGVLSPPSFIRTYTAPSYHFLHNGTKCLRWTSVTLEVACFSWLCSFSGHVSQINNHFPIYVQQLTQFLRWFYHQFQGLYILSHLLHIEHTISYTIKLRMRNGGSREVRAKNSRNQMGSVQKSNIPYAKGTEPENSNSSVNGTNTLSSKTENK